MNKKLTHLPLLLISATVALFCTACGAPKQDAVILELQASPWDFATNQVPLSTLNTQKPEDIFTSPSDSSGFTIKLKIDLKKPEAHKTLLKIPDVLELNWYSHNPADRRDQNYPAYPMADGSVPVLEAALRLHLPVEPSEVRDMKVGIPLAMLKNPEGEHEVVLHFSGVRWTMYVDGELLDNDFPLGYPRWKNQAEWEMDPSLVSEVEIFSPGIEPQKGTLHTPRISKGIQYWTPEGHNTWVGDVATFYHQGRYHVFYLYDRRGHASKFGRGGHYFEHLSTADFKTWTEHQAATPIEEQWETMGTGTPFVFNDKLCISYGLHTTRIYTAEKTTLPLQWDYYNEHGETGSFLYNTLPGYPAGSTYSVSGDGISDFSKTHILFHPCENPSVYTDPEGRLRMLANYGAKGTWESASIDGGWRSVNPGFPPGGDCTFFFRWGGFDYVIGGFTGLWSKPADATEESYESVVKDGLDFYNGMCVPAITEIPDGRFLMAGWIPMVNWGGTLNIHEMIQYPDGRIGTKWMEEILPSTGKLENLAKRIDGSSSFDTQNSSFLLTFDVDASDLNNGKLAVLMSGAGDEHCEFQVDLSSKRAQYAEGTPEKFAGQQKSLREGGYPNQARNYAIENLIGTDKPFTVRMIVKYGEKFGGSQIDAEIAGQRTMITFRPGLEVNRISFMAEDTGISNVKVAPLTK